MSERYVDACGLPEFTETLWEWIHVIDRCVRIWNGSGPSIDYAPEKIDVPWWHNERASVSIFAGAVWRTGGIVFEEFSIRRMPGEEDRKVAKTSAGKCDLYMHLNGNSYIAEAKQAWSPAGEKSQSSIECIAGALDEAAKQIKTLAESDRREGERQLAITFATPYLRKSYYDKLNDLVDDWLNDVAEIKCLAKAWNFPVDWRNKVIHSGSFYPGAAIFIREAV